MRESGFRSWKDAFFICILSGALWGLVAMLVNSVTGAFEFEFNTVHDLVTFVTGGAVFGLVTGGLFAVLAGVLPWRSMVTKAVLVSTSIWTALAVTGYILTIIKPIRYHFDLGQSIQGLCLSVVLGAILGTLWKMALRASREDERAGLRA